MIRVLKCLVVVLGNRITSCQQGPSVSDCLLQFGRCFLSSLLEQNLEGTCYFVVKDMVCSSFVRTSIFTVYFIISLGFRAYEHTKNVRRNLCWIWATRKSGRNLCWATRKSGGNWATRKSCRNLCWATRKSGGNWATRKRTMRKGLMLQLLYLPLHIEQLPGMQRLN